MVLVLQSYFGLVQCECSAVAGDKLAMHIFYRYHNEVLFSQVDIITKILKLMIFKYFEFLEYFDDVKYCIIQ